jgi:hypothetical protein
MVSGTISLPSRGTFHHSLTVLIRYRSPGSIQPYQVVLANSPHITRVRGYSRTIHGRPRIFGYRTLTLYGAALTRLRLTLGFITPGHVVSHTTNSLTTPHWQPLTGITPAWFRHISAFARHYSRNHYLFSLPAGTEMFHFPAFPPNTLCIQVRVTRHDSCRVTPFGHPGITARLTAPPGLSRPPTSFIGSWYQGIHHLPYTTSTNQNDPPTHPIGARRRTQKTRCSRPLCTSQPTTNHHPTPDTSPGKHPAV